VKRAGVHGSRGAGGRKGTKGTDLSEASPPAVLQDHEEDLQAGLDDKGDDDQADEEADSVAPAGVEGGRIFAFGEEGQQRILIPEEAV
jgi:hypothetical protein